MNVKKIVYYELNLEEAEYNRMLQIVNDKVTAGTATQEELNMSSFMQANI